MGTLNRRDFLRLMTSGTAAAMLGGCAGSIMPEKSGTSKPPNILFLFTDDQRFDTIHALGNMAIFTLSLNP